MTTLDELLDERRKRKTVENIKTMSDEEFKEMIVDLLVNIGLKVEASVLSDGKLFLEAEGEGEQYLVLAVRNSEGSIRDALLKIGEKAEFERRIPVLILTSEMNEEAKKFAEEEQIVYADRSKLINLMEKYNLTTELMREVDQRVLESEGSRYLPSLGKFDSLMNSADEDIEEEEFGAALSKLNRAARIKPQQAELWKKKARALFSMGRYEEAIEACRKSLSIRPGDAGTWYMMGLILHEDGDLKGEISAYDEALERSPQMVSALLNKGATLHQMGEEGAALGVYDTMLDYYPEDPRAYNNRALVLKSMGRTDEALESLDKALELNTSYRDAMINRANLLLEIGDPEESIAAWKEMLSSGRSEPMLWMELGMAQKEAGRLEEAARSFAIAATLDPQLEEARTERDQALSAVGIDKTERVDWGEETVLRGYLDRSLLLEAVGDIEGALEEVEKCLELDPHMPEANLRQAHLLLDIGHLEEALTSLREGIDSPEGENTMLDLEALLFRMGRWNECGSMLRDLSQSSEGKRRRCLLYLQQSRADRAVDCSRNLDQDAVGEMTLAMSLMKKGHFAKAVGKFEELRDRFPSAPEILNNLGVCLRYTGGMEEAQSILNKAVEIEPRCADAWNNLGTIYYLEGSFEECEKCIQQALLVERKPHYLVNLGVCQMALEELDEAQESFMSAMQMERLPEAINGLGVIAERRREIVKALEFYEAALEEEPRFQDAALNRERVRKELED